MAAKDWERLAEFVRERRVELGLTQEDARAAGGPSTATMRLLEGALQHSYQPATLRDLENVLQWGRGSVRMILAGGDPVPLADFAGAPRAVPAIARREVPFHAGAGSSDEDWQPYVTEIRREAREVLVNLYGGDVPGPDDPRAETATASLPGRLVFPGDDEESRLEAETWDQPSLTLGEKTRVIAVGRWLRHRADERENRQTGLSHVPATNAIPALFSVAGREFRASS